MLKLESFIGSNALKYVFELSQLRLEIFREFPYLYDGNFEYEEKYLSSYFSCPESIVTLAFSTENKIVGAATGLPLRNADEDWQTEFYKNDFDISEIFYIGEFLLLGEYRGLGLGHRFFDITEQFAKTLPSIKFSSFATVVRNSGHKDMPQNYRNLDTLWLKRGYSKIPQLQTQFKWKDLNETSETYKKMDFWLKNLY